MSSSRRGGRGGGRGGGLVHADSRKLRRGREIEGVAQTEAVEYTEITGSVAKQDAYREADPASPGGPMTPRSQAEYDRIVPKLTRQTSVMRKKSMFANANGRGTSGSARRHKGKRRQRTIQFADDQGEALDKTYFTESLYYSNFYESTRDRQYQGGGGCCVLS